MFMKNVLFILLIMLCASMACAGTIDAYTLSDVESSTDNVKSYDSKTNTVSIFDKDTDSLLASAKLLTPLVNNVGVGYVKVAEFELDAKVSSAEFLKQMYFFDKRASGLGISRAYDLRVAVDYVAKEPVYDKVCYKFDKNGEEYCVTEEVSFKDVIRTRYDLLTAKSFDVSKKKISVWTTTVEGESVEWVPDLYGVAVTEWATWNASLANDLNSWYKFDETSGTVAIDSKGFDHNGAINGVTIDQPGILGRAYDFDGANTDYIATNQKFGNGRTTFSISAWVYPQNPAENDAIAFSRSTNVTGLSMGPSGILRSYINGTVCDSAGGKIVSNRWNHVVMVYDGNSIMTYSDSNLVAQCAKTGAIALTANFEVGRDTGSATFNFDGLIDEVSFWDTNLSRSDINILYNKGAGNSYPFSAYNFPIFDFNFDPTIIRYDASYYGTVNNAHITPGDNSYIIFIDNISGVDTNGKNLKTLYPGKINYAYDLDNFGGLFAGYNTVQRMQYAVNFGASVWVKTSSSDNMAIIANMNNRTVSNYEGWLLTLENGYIKWRMGDTNNSASETLMTSANTYNDNQWHNIIITYDGITKRMYIDGNLTPQEQTSGFSSGELAWKQLFGQMYVNAGYDWKYTGQVDQLKFWDTNLTADDVNKIWFEGGGEPPEPPTPTIPVHTTFNVYRWGTSTHLTGITFDANVDALDLSGQSSPFSTIDYDQNTVVLATFSRAGYDNNTFIWAGDANRTYTIYLKDTTLPSVGQTSAAGYTIVGTQIWGTGTINATASDLGSGINTCEYTITNGPAWFAADKNATHCYKTITVASGSTYTFNLRATDYAGNTGTGTKTVTYTGDNVAPSVGATTYSGFTTSGTYITGNGKIVGGTATDAVSGINNTTCQVQYFNGGAWFAGNWVTDHCESDPFTAADTTAYKFNTRITDNAGNTGTGTATSTYTGSSSPPTVGQTTFTGFTEYTTGGYWFKGTGNIISGTAADTNSGINESSCEYTSNDEVSWGAATWDTDHCKYDGFTPNNGVSYTFNFRILNNLSISGTGTKTYTYIGDTVGPTVTSDAAATYNNNATVTLTASDGIGSGIKRVWYCTDSTNSCTPGTIGSSVSLTCANGFVCTYYIRAVSTDNLDNNSDTYASGLITIDRVTTVSYPENETNKNNWLSMVDVFSENIFGFDYTVLGIVALIILAIIAFLFRINALVAILLSIPFTFAFLMLTNGTSLILSIILVLEIIALGARVAMSILNIGNQGA